MGDFGGFLKGFFEEATEIRRRAKEAELRKQERRDSLADQLELYIAKTKIDEPAKLNLFKQKEEIKAKAAADRQARTRQFIESVSIKDSGPTISVDQLMAKRDEAIIQFGKDSPEAAIMTNKVKDAYSKASFEDKPMSGRSGVTISSVLDAKRKEREESGLLKSSPFFRHKKVDVSALGGSVSEHQQSEINAEEMATAIAEKTAKVSEATGTTMPTSALGASRIVDLSEKLEAELNVLEDVAVTPEDKKAAIANIEQLLSTAGLSIDVMVNDPAFSRVLTPARKQAITDVKGSAESMAKNLEKEREAILLQFKAGKISRAEAKRRLLEL